VFCELLFTLCHTVASERKVVRPMYLEQTQTVTLSSFLHLSRKLTEELKAWEIYIVCKICKAKFEEKFPVLQDKNYVAML